MRRPTLLALAVLVSASAPAAGAGASGAEDPLVLLQREGLSSTRAFDVVRSLCDQVGPRMAGSPGDRAAVAWALAAMGRQGLARVHAEPVKVRHWERGEGRAEITAPSPHALVVAALGGSVATPPGGIEAEVVEARDVAELKTLDPARVRGKLVFLDPVMRRARDGAGYGEAVGNRGEGAGAAQALGAVGLLLRSVGTDHDRVAHTGAKRSDPHEIPAAALSVPDAELLHRLLAERSPVRVRLVLGSRTLPDADSANVIGEVPGRERPNEVVVMGAHLDSWDQGQGALDDGAGVAIALEAARLVALHPPRRTVRVVLYANEEHGIDGAKAYARAHAGEAAAHVAATEADFGDGAVYAIRFRGDPAARDRFAQVARALAPLGVERDDRDGHGGSDVGELAGLGVPLLDLRQDGTRYFDFHHTPNDTVDKIDPGVLESAAVAFATSLWTVAEMPGDLGRVPESARKD